MKIFNATIFFCLLIGFTSKAQVKIGLPAGAPQSSSILDLSNLGNPTKGLALPRVATTNNIVAPVEGMIVYDISSKSIKAYENSTWVSYTNSATPPVALPVVAVNNFSSAINGSYSQNVPLTAANTVTVAIDNNSFSSVALIPAVTDVVLSGIGAAGISVASVSPASINPGSGGSSLITYSLSGTPTNLGPFTTTFTKLSLSFTKESAVCVPTTPITVTSTTNPTTLPNPVVAGNTVNFTAAGGPAGASLTWTMTSSPATGVFTNSATGTGNTAQAILAANAAGEITVVFATTNECNALVSGTKTVSFGDALLGALTAGGCASCAAYNAAAVNTWVNITAAEYAQLDNFIPINVAACKESIMSGPLAGALVDNATLLTIGPGSLTLPANNYVVAFSAIVGGYAGSPTGWYLKYSSNSTTGFSMSGPSLSITGTSGQTRIYNILKKPSSIINSSAASYIAVYQPGQAPMISCANNSTGNITYYSTGDTNSVSSTLAGYISLFQVKGTATKKW